MRLRAIYGDRWRKQFNRSLFKKPEHYDLHVKILKNEWLRAIGNFSNEVIGTAIDWARDQFEFPPSISQFVKLCEQASDKLRYEKEYNCGKLIENKEKTIEEKQRSKEIALKSLREIYDKLHKR